MTHAPRIKETYMREFFRHDVGERSQFQHRRIEQRMIEEMATSLVSETQKDQVQIAKLMSHQ